jgi:hypothetical protein
MVRVRREDDMLVIDVEDEGPGLRPDVLERIFERFYTDRAEQSGYGNNSGLGLSISRQIIEVHGGTIEAANRPGNTEGESGGARFTVRSAGQQPTKPGDGRDGPRPGNRPCHRLVLEGTGIAIRGASGSGKSRLALALLQAAGCQPTREPGSKTMADYGAHRR